MIKNWKNINELIEYPKEGILSKVLSKTKKMEATLFCMAKGTDISDHTSTKAGLVYVIEGQGNFNLQGEDIIMSAGVLIPMDSGAVHSLSAQENTSFILILNNNN